MGFFNNLAERESANPLSAELQINPISTFKNSSLSIVLVHFHPLKYTQICVQFVGTFVGRKNGDR